MTREEKLRAAKIARARMQQSQLAAAEPTGQGYGNNLAQAVGDGMFMGFGDEISARLNAMTGYDANTGSYGNWGTTYDDQLGAVRQQDEQFSEQNPITALGANVGGAVLPAALGIGAVVSAPTTAGRMIRGAQVGAAAGAVQGFGEGEGGVVNRTGSGVLGAGMGAALGGAIPGIAEVGRQAYRGVEGAIRNSRIGNQVGQSLGISPSAGRFMANSVGAEDAATMREALGRAGPDAMLADASPAMARRLDATLNAPVAGAASARDRINSRAGSAYYDIIDALDGGRQGPQLPVQAQMDQIRTSTAGARGSAYDAAYSQEIDWRSPAGENLRALLDSTPDEVKNAAARSRGMRVQPTQVPESAYPEMAPQVSMGSGADSWIAREGAEIDEFASAYGAMNGRPQARRPLSTVIRGLGGIDPDGEAARELRAMGITSRNSPALFRKGGLRDVDNLSPDLFPDTVQNMGDGTGNYMDRDTILNRIVDEMNGTATRSSNDMLDARAIDEMERLLPEYDARAAELAARIGGPDAPGIFGDIVPMQTVEDVDMIKRQLDAIVDTNEGQGKLGGLTPYGLFARDRAVAIRDALKEAAPGYGKALETAADPIRRRQAVEFGSRLLNPRTTTEEAMQEIARATGGERTAMRAGLRAQIDETLGNVRAVASDSNIEPRQAMQALRELSSPNAQRKMEALYGSDWQPIKEQIDRASAALGLRAGTSANSATASRLLADREITDEVTPGALRQGKPLEALKNFAGGITGASPEAIARSRDEVKSEIADLLTRQGGAPQQVINQVVQALMANPSNPATGNGIRDVVTALGLTAVPGLTERLQRTLGTLP